MNRFYHKSEISLEKWDELVSQTANSDIFNYSFYLNAVAKDWGIFSNSNLTFGIVLPFVNKMGKKQIYTPVFYRYTELIGDANDFNLKDFVNCLKQNFKLGQLNFKTDLLSDNSFFKLKNKTFQTITDEHKPKSLAKRMIKKANSEKFEISRDKNNIEQCIDFIFLHLSKKLPVFDKKSTEKTFKSLISGLNKENSLILRAVKKNKNLIAVAFYMKNENRITYLKGATDDKYKNSGVFYLLMNEAIKECQEERLVFDFGGSSDENVRFFNTRFSAVDQNYFSVEWGKASFLHKVIQKIKNG